MLRGMLPGEAWKITKDLRAEKEVVGKALEEGPGEVIRAVHRVK